MIILSCSGTSKECTQSEGQNRVVLEGRKTFMAKSRIPSILHTYEEELLEEWIREQLASDTWRADLLTESELRQQSAEFLGALRQAAESDNLTDIMTPQWSEARDILTDLSRSRMQQGFAASETATFIFSLKQPLFTRLRQELEQDDYTLANEYWAATVLLDQLGLFTTEAYQSSREAIIGRQQEELLELSTPVVKLWDGILAVPLIGTLDSGIRPQIAQTMVELGVDLDVTTKASLAEALRLALQRSDQTIIRTPRDAAGR